MSELALGVARVGMVRTRQHGVLFRSYIHVVRVYMEAMTAPQKARIDTFASPEIQATP
jgi:hypothetical protein